VAAARAEVLQARRQVEDEAARLRESLRASLDLAGQLRRRPLRTASLLAGSAFLLVGGPARLWRRWRGRGRHRGGLLPDEVERIVASLGPDGATVKQALEEGFARYLETEGGRLRRRRWSEMAAGLAGALLSPVFRRAGIRLAEALLDASQGANRDRAKEPGTGRRWGDPPPRAG
jgi:hypothetical protein